MGKILSVSRTGAIPLRQPSPHLRSRYSPNSPPEAAALSLPENLDSKYAQKAQRSEYGKLTAKVLGTDLRLTE